MTAVMLLCEDTLCGGFFGSRVFLPPGEVDQQNIKLLNDH